MDKPAIVNLSINHFKEIDEDFTPSLMSKIKLKYDEEKDIHDLAVEIINEACLEDYLEVSPQNEA